MVTLRALHVRNTNNLQIFLTNALNASVIVSLIQYLSRTYNTKIFGKDNIRIFIKDTIHHKKEII